MWCAFVSFVATERDGSLKVVRVINRLNGGQVEKWPEESTPSSEIEERRGTIVSWPFSSSYMPHPDKKKQNIAEKGTKNASERAEN